MNVYLAEFLGTAILILFGGGVCANVNLKRSAANGADWIVITAGWGLAVTMGVYAVGQFSGAHLNPAVSLALALDGSFDWSLVPGYIVAQMLGAIVGATIVWLMYLPRWKYLNLIIPLSIRFKVPNGSLNYILSKISVVLLSSSLNFSSNK
ncbi:Aquaporin Z [Staphylococcus aureus]